MKHSVYPPICIYGLIDPRNNELKYVGKTHMGIAARFKQHTTYITHLPVSRWIKGLLELGTEPLAVELESGVPESTWQEAEQFWIAYFKTLGANLLNVSKGGNHRVGPKRISMEVI